MVSSADRASEGRSAKRKNHRTPYAWLKAGAVTLGLGAALAGGPGHVVSNLPYNVGTPLLIKWLTGLWRPHALTLMFQKEVAERIVAAPGDDAYGRLAVIAQAVAAAVGTGTILPSQRTGSSCDLPGAASDTSVPAKSTGGTAFSSAATSASSSRTR
jgi:hypothetical protein